MGAMIDTTSKNALAEQIRSFQEILATSPHPEELEGEVLLTNCRACDYSSIGWNPKRAGLIAYNKNGVRCGTASTGFFPVFISRGEVLLEISRLSKQLG